MKNLTHKSSAYKEDDYGRGWRLGIELALKHVETLLDKNCPEYLDIKKSVLEETGLKEVSIVEICVYCGLRDKVTEDLKHMPYTTREPHCCPPVDLEIGDIVALPKFDNPNEPDTGTRRGQNCFVKSLARTGSAELVWSDGEPGSCITRALRRYNKGDPPKGRRCT